MNSTRRGHSTECGTQSTILYWQPAAIPHGSPALRDPVIMTAGRHSGPLQHGWRWPVTAVTTTTWLKTCDSCDHARLPSLAMESSASKEDRAKWTLITVDLFLPRPGLALVLATKQLLWLVQTQPFVNESPSLMKHILLAKEVAALLFFFLAFWVPISSDPAGTLLMM